MPGSCFRELLPPVTDRGGKPNLLLVVTNDRHYYSVPYTDTVFSKMRSRCGAFPPYAYLSTPICGPTRATLLGVNWPHSARGRGASFTPGCRLRQRSSCRGFRGQLEERASLEKILAHKRVGEGRGLRVHRDLLRPGTQAFCSRVSQPDRI